jgi:parallel beta-helix repeat protein
VLERIRCRPHYAYATARPLLLTALVVSAFVALTALHEGRAFAAKVNCGDTITTDVTLHHNLVNCPNNGLVIGADNVTLDLNYHTIDGNGKPTGGCDPQTDFCDIGIANFGYDGVTVVHGSLRQFGGGVDFGQVAHNRLLDISASKNADIGIQLFGCSRSVVRNSSGIGSTSRRNGTGLGLFGCHDSRVLRNSVRHNAGHHGLVLVDSNDVLVKGNRVSGNGGEGVILEGGERNKFARNRVVRNDAGITLGPGSHNVIARNRVSRGRDGIRIEKGHDNLIADNVVSHARRAGIRLGISHPFVGGAGNVVRGNVVKETRDDGFLVNRKDNHSLLEGNIGNGAGDDGFDVRSRSAKLTSNRARRNGDLGIAAVRGVIDGGGNRASGNGDRRQCVNVACG